MRPDNLANLLTRLRDGEISVEEATDALKTLPFETLGDATIDRHRELRQGFPEVVYCEGKTDEQAADVICKLAEEGDALGSRASRRTFDIVRETRPDAVYHARARVVAVPCKERTRPIDESKYILVVAAGASDLPVAEEAAVIARYMGNRVETAYDVGVAGLHRLLSRVELLRGANVVVVVAGMDGALPSVVGGLVERPVVAVPTSVGYGAAFGGLAPLLTMLNSCAPGVAVVNIDNGFGAAAIASRINHL
ncbi:MAG: nickel pincer cofactor biosynthesis protein LarB [Ignavibacteriales bacterium]|nr:nickel pincer cofactor biosynthesis protein LarB [Ignavibacteriales bacterium]